MKKFSAYHIWQNVVIFHPILLFSMVLSLHLYMYQ